MPNDNQTAQIATLTADQRNLKEGVEKAINTLTGEVRAGNQQNGQIISGLAVLNEKQENNAKYQDKCDKERAELRKDVTAIKTKAALISMGCSWVIPALVEAWLHK